jgi:hypothetical protein
VIVVRVAVERGRSSTVRKIIEEVMNDMTEVEATVEIVLSVIIPTMLNPKMLTLQMTSSISKIDCDDVSLLHMGTEYCDLRSFFLTNRLSLPLITFTKCSY